jgi:hypothetical protein
MPTFEAIELAGFRDEAEMYLPDSCQVLRPTRTKDAVGTWVTVGTAVAHTYDCRLNAGAPREFIVGAQLAGEVLWTMTLAHDADVLHDDTLSVSGHALKIVGAASGGSYVSALRLVCREML